MKSSIRLTLVSLGFLAQAAFAQNASVMRPTEIRAEKLASSAVLVQVNQGATVRITSVEGGWVLVEANTDTGRVSGWVRASALNMQAGTSVVAGLSSGREAAGNTAVTLGVRNVPPLVPRINKRFNFGRNCQKGNRRCGSLGKTLHWRKFSKTQFAPAKPSV